MPIMSTKSNALFLCNFDTHGVFDDTAPIAELWQGNWCSKNIDLKKSILSTNLEVTQLTNELKKQYDSNLEEIISIGIGALLTFCEQNWNPSVNPLILTEYFGTEWPNTINAAIELQSDSEEICTNIVYLELLLFSSRILSSLYSIEQNLLHLWWHFRCKVTHQRVLEDTSATLFSEINLLMAKLCNEAHSLEPRLRILLYAELCQASLLYDRIQEAEEHLLKAMNLGGLKLELTGVLGKRTKFQMKALPQLALSSNIETANTFPSAVETHGSTQLPTNITLQDDVRLSQIQYNEKVPQAELPSLEQTLCLCNVTKKHQLKRDKYDWAGLDLKSSRWSSAGWRLLTTLSLLCDNDQDRRLNVLTEAWSRLYLQKAQPKDNLLHEELFPYIETILAQKTGPWSTRVAALFLRCRLEAKNKRTVERAMMQCEEICSDENKDTPANRLSYLWASGLSPVWVWRQQLADLYCSMGLVKSALEIYLKLQLWEDVILCYTLLQLRHKAAEVIIQQLDVKPSVKLYCYLGDVTDDVSCYEKAWELSGHKSSRAQRHWGSYYFNMKKYEECIPHFEKSLEINSLQESVWLRLGYAALVTEHWEKSANAYRRYTYLQPNSFEAWNNLAKAYVKQGHKQRAYRTLMEAIKYNYDNWKLWENVITVSVDVGQFDDVIHGCHRVLDLQNKYLDIEVLSILVQETLKTMKADGDSNEVPKHGLRKSVLELFGRITSIHRKVPEIWCLYADISPQPAKTERLLQAYRAYTQAINWPDNPEKCMNVIRLSQRIIKELLEGMQKELIPEASIAQVTSSVRLMARAVIKASQSRNWPETVTDLEQLQRLFETFMEMLKNK